MYRRGDVIAVPYEYSDLSGGKVRPAVVVSSDAYNLARLDVVAAGISTQVSKVSSYDYILSDWAIAGLRYPSLVRGRLLTLEQSLIHRTIGRLSLADLAGVEAKLASFLLSNITVAEYLISEIDLTLLPGRVVQALAEKSLQASVNLTKRAESDIHIERLRALFPPLPKSEDK
ncbi:MAG: type II toxin-antitoxin system PemK/MazF family toxin [Caldilineaceae bacterium]